MNLNDLKEEARKEFESLEDWHEVDGEDIYDAPSKEDALKLLYKYIKLTAQAIREECWQDCLDEKLDIAKDRKVELKQLLAAEWKKAAKATRERDIAELNKVTLRAANAGVKDNELGIHYLQEAVEALNNLE